MIAGLHHMAIIASEKGRTLAFYEALGFRVKACHPRPERKDEIVFMETAGITLEVFVSQGNPLRVTGPEAYGLRHAAFAVTDAEAAREALLRAGYQPEPLRCDAINGKAMFFVKDPDGLPIEIHE